MASRATRRYGKTTSLAENAFWSQILGEKLLQNNYFGGGRGPVSTIQSTLSGAPHVETMRQRPGVDRDEQAAGQDNEAAAGRDGGAAVGRPI